MEQKSVGMVILGAGGYMGKNGIHALKYLSKKLEEENIALRLLSFAEPREQNWEEIKDLCSSCINQRPLEANRLVEALPLVEALRGEDHYPVIIYDATPTTLHFGNLLEVHQREDNTLLYLGEKPIFTDEYEIKYLTENTGEDFQFFCEFIETENPVFLAVHKYLNKVKTDLSIKEMWLWRAGCSGIKKAISIGRGGVEGGALEDKSLHDLSISAGLLGSTNIEEVIVEDARIHSLILHSDYFFKENRKAFLTAGNKSSSQIIANLKEKDLLPADGLFSMRVTWKLPDREVPAKYLFSWVGYNQLEQELEFVSELERLGFPIEPADVESSYPKHAPRKWLDISEPFKYVNQTEHYQAKMQEVRIGIFKCDSATGEKYIVCNFLSKYNLHRYAYVVELKDGRAEIIETLFLDEDSSTTYEEKKGADLSKIFDDVVKHAFGIKRADFIGRKTTLLTHGIMIEARKQAIENLSTDAERWFEAAKGIFERNITVTKV